MFHNNLYDEEDSCGGYQCSRIAKQHKMSDLFDDDKENEELSLYETASSSSNEFTACDIFEDHDPNSLDSGYAATNGDSPKGSYFELMENVFDISEVHNDENTQLIDIPELLHNPIKNILKDTSNETKSFKRSLSMFTTTTCTNSSKVRSCLFKNENENQITSKRATSPETICSPKRLRVLGSVENKVPARNNNFQRSQSTTENSIKSAFQRESSEQVLIGDFSKEFSLPLIRGRHQDLKSIAPTTLAMLIKGHFAHLITSFKIIDCRYPYEYDGGHISGAVNLYSKQQILDGLLNNQSVEYLKDVNKTTQRHVLVFHCEFSSERGPNLSRFLRSLDRTKNAELYPSLYYPEIYLLDGGYKSFYSEFSELCVPNAYLPMLHPEHESALRFYRVKSKTFNCDARLKSSSRSYALKRL